MEATTASLHDSRIDLSKPDEVVYRDRGYSGTETKGYNATMKKGASVMSTFKYRIKSG